MLVVIRQAVRVLQLFGRQFGSQQTRASSPVPRHDGYKLCRWPIYMAAILANSTRSLFIAEIPTYVHTYVCGPLHSARSIVVREGGWRGRGLKPIHGQPEKFWKPRDRMDVLLKAKNVVTPRLPDNCASTCATWSFISAKIRGAMIVVEDDQTLAWDEFC